MKTDVKASKQVKKAQCLEKHLRQSEPGPDSERGRPKAKQRRVAHI